MPDGNDKVIIRIADGACDLAPAAWDRCAGGDDPFVSHAFFRALEESGSACAATGWLPRHLVIDDQDGEPVAIAPLYLKNHSYGEYIFDWGWAEAYEHAGGRCYPKLQAAVPFTPVTGRRFLVAPQAPAKTADALAAGMVSVAERLDASSIHVTFATEGECQSLARQGFLPRIGHQFHWRNESYRSFDAFLGALSSRKRKAIRKERQAVRDDGIELRTLTGADIRESHWDAFYRFYRDTTGRKWGQSYLRRAFFSLLHEGLRDRVVLFLAFRGKQAIGGALNLLGQDALYGRYWGAIEQHRYLHFEACYYQAIDYAITAGLSRVEAGAQGEHKIQRGYLPVEVHSAHWIADPNLRSAIARFLMEERRLAGEEIAALRTESPYRSGGGDATS